MSLFELFHSYFNLDIETGYLTRKFTIGGKQKGGRAGTTHHSGYRIVKIKGKCYAEHRLIWFMHYGYWPFEIDHINLDKSDNRISNLREVTKSQNAWNIKLSSRNSTGTKGLSEVGDAYWRAKISFNGEAHIRHFPKTLKGKKEAISWLKQKRKQLHGEYAR